MRSSTDRRERSGSAGSAKSAISRASSSMGLDGGEAGRRMAAEDELIRRELQDTTSFCNSFWGMNDAGYPVIQNRMKAATRIVEDVRAMYKERADIEAEYAKRLAKLAGRGIGKEETGSMRVALDVVRAEIEHTARSHAELSNVFKKDLEGQLGEFSNRVQAQRKTSQANIEKLFKQKSTQEAYVNKSREKYEQDCIRINGYTAQSSLVQGRDLEKVTSKLDKAQSTVSGNDKDYQNFVRALKDTTLRWNTEWKGYLDQCQDLEEERLEFLKSNLWNYANAISSVCVADDQSCERVRVGLETCEAARDIVDFIQRAGTGVGIVDPPEYINYARGQPPPSRPSFKTANFQRTTTRQPTFVAPIAPAQEPSMPDLNAVAKGAPPHHAQRKSTGGDGDDVSGGYAQPQNDATTVPSARLPPGAVAMPGMVPTSETSSSMNTVKYHPSAPGDDEAALRAAKADRRISAKHFLQRTPSRGQSSLVGKPSTPSQMGYSQQQQQSANTASQRTLPPSETAGTTIISPAAAEDDDPIARALADLRMKPSRSPAPGQASSARTGGVPASQTSGFGGGQDMNMGQSSSSGGQNRPRSPSAAFMQEPERSTSPMPVEEVLGQYGQSFPGERRSMSRQNSTASRNSRMSMHGGSSQGQHLQQQQQQQQQQQPQRARSPAPGEGSSTSGFAGVGARGRSPSPQPYQQQQQQQAPQQQQNRARSPQGRPSIMQGRPTQSGLQQYGAPQRSTTPLGINLDASGSVTHDQMADDFIKRTGSVGPAQGRPITPQHNQYASNATITPSQHQDPPPPPQHQQSYSQQQPVYSGQHGAQQPLHGNVSVAPTNPAMAQQQQYGYNPAAQATAQHAAAAMYHQQAPTGYSPSVAHSTPQAQPAPQQQQSMYQPPGGVGYQSPSPYNQRPATAAVPPPAQSYGQAPSQYGGPQQNASPYGPPSGGGPGPAAETPASAYMQQYRQSYHGAGQQSTASPAPAPAVAAPAQYGQWNAQQQAQPQSAAAARPVNGAGLNGYGGGGGGGGGSSGGASSSGAPVHPQASRPNEAASAPTTAAGTPNGPPTGQYSDAGKPILFYVKALYDYQHQLNEEFSFTAGDVIAVWETNPDGWWQGELLDDARRRPGSNTFPSNFVSLLN